MSFEFCHNLSFGNMSLFEWTFVTIWVFEFCHNLSFWALSQFELLSFVKIWVIEFVTRECRTCWARRQYWCKPYQRASMSCTAQETNFHFFCVSSCPSYLKSSYYEINMWTRPRSWPSSVASRPAGRPGSGRSRRRGRWQMCFTLRRFER